MDCLLEKHAQEESNHTVCSLSEEALPASICHCVYALGVCQELVQDCSSPDRQEGVEIFLQSRLWHVAWDAPESLQDIKHMGIPVKACIQGTAQPFQHHNLSHQRRTTCSALRGCMCAQETKKKATKAAAKPKADKPKPQREGSPPSCSSPTPNATRCRSHHILCLQQTSSMFCNGSR